MKRQITGLIDVHTHLLPGADDGSRYLGETMELIRAAYQQGVREFLATPHYRHGRNRIPVGEIQVRFELVKQKAADQFPDVALYL